MTMSKSHKKWIMWVLVIAVSFSVGFLVRQPAGASTAEPGSSADPIAAKSYVDEMAKFTRVTIEGAGKEFIGGEYTEFFIRQGSPVAINVAPNAGLSNLTRGVDISSSVTIPRDNLILVPRAGRGFKTVDNTTIVYVKGKYSIRN